jgi:hypothetical protein
MYLSTTDLTDVGVVMTTPDDEIVRDRADEFLDQRRAHHRRAVDVQSDL